MRKNYASLRTDASDRFIKFMIPLEHSLVVADKEKTREQPKKLHAKKKNMRAMCAATAEISR